MSSYFHVFSINNLSILHFSVYTFRCWFSPGSHAPVWEPIWYVFPRWSAGARKDRR